MAEKGRRDRTSTLAFLDLCCIVKNRRIQEVNEWNRRVVADFSPHQVCRAERS